MIVGQQSSYRFFKEVPMLKQLWRTIYCVIMRQQATTRRAVSASTTVYVMVERRLAGGMRYTAACV